MHAPSDLAFAGRMLAGVGLAYLIGFERELRGSPAGDRTFSLIGLATTAAAAATGQSSPQALAGILTGVGFLGGGLIVKGKDDAVHGITTAATVFATAVVGLVVGLGHLALGAGLSALLLVVLELRFIPGLRFLDARSYSARVQSEGQAAEVRPHQLGTAGPPRAGQAAPPSP